MTAHIHCTDSAGSLHDSPRRPEIVGCTAQWCFRARALLHPSPCRRVGWTAHDWLNRRPLQPRQHLMIKTEASDQNGGASKRIASSFVPKQLCSGTNSHERATVDSAAAAPCRIEVRGYILREARGRALVRSPYNYYLILGAMK